MRVTVNRNKVQRMSEGEAEGCKMTTIVSKTLMSKVEKAYHKTDEDSTRTAGLEKVVRLCAGA